MKKDVIPIAAMLIMFLGPIITLWLVGAFAPLVDWLGKKEPMNPRKLARRPRIRTK
jgi:hypothetical protein